MNQNKIYCLLGKQFVKFVGNWGMLFCSGLPVRSFRRCAATDLQAVFSFIRFRSCQSQCTFCKPFGFFCERFPALFNINFMLFSFHFDAPFQRIVPFSYFINFHDSFVNKAILHIRFKVNYITLELLKCYSSKL